MNKVAVVSGAASGIGRSVVLRLLDEGWSVVGLDADEAGLTALQDDCAAHVGRLELRACDVSKEADVAAAFSFAAERHAKVHGVVLSAGLLRVGRLEDMAVEDFDRLFAVNVRGLWLCARAALPLLRAAAASGEAARIVNLASIAGIRHKINSGAYAATKAAVMALTRVLAVEVAGDGILVNAVAPATVDTPMVAPHMQSGSNTGYKTSGVSPLGRIAQPQDIAAVVAFLLGPDAAYVTGTVVPVDGGTTAAFVPR